MAQGWQANSEWQAHVLFSRKSVVSRLGPPPYRDLHQFFDRLMPELGKTTFLLRAYFTVVCSYRDLMQKYQTGRPLHTFSQYAYRVWLQKIARSNVLLTLLEVTYFNKVCAYRDPSQESLRWRAIRRSWALARSQASAISPGSIGQSRRAILMASENPPRCLRLRNNASRI